jgi:2-polyprenyl-6-methoxyphenol hydroxylase-like FAD-dependent oxidoreductase
MTEAYVLAGELARAEGDVAAALRAYETGLRPFVAGKQKAAKGFAGFFAPKTALGVWMRTAAARLLAVPGLGGLMLGNSVKDDLELPDYSLPG